ncbi:hypothetical protein CNBE1990 [Cryptococcus deneoformans B-3501A]|uniref:Uncharacterized protein n=1 Tax=Cryptococcus deneoformans (strain JEC21 / ATCC MYA-565) TaxID=214684 RepID=A0A0S2LIM7_CRYD1|nr:hypothetical protein CNE02025 [Cryptococcus neoformans var. neoformans JEC21]XP_775485.1 hypothetical protein CNBE1990 [Cryptococcus neoformans var. neoformans B-3501A]ALO60563.1 hypothetical protein CNE02025 [Cryptococcus neoformans var. neoformans JEC21]EAL20838.1 hypothetical protein CNBE1990 [Cryptococcus neoformans var. neoformans B-3501A]
MITHMQGHRAISKRPLYPPRPPPGIKRKLWEWKIKFDCTFALSVMGPGEQMVIGATFAIIALLVLVYVYNYLPSQISHTSRRLAYYIHGDEKTAHFMEEIGRNILRGWTINMNGKGDPILA